VRLVVLGDVGVVDGMIHIGDEAMFEAMATQLAARGAAITAVSSSPADTSERYGVDAIPPIGFDLSQGRPAAEHRMTSILAAAHGGADPVDDRARTVLEAVAASDGVAIAGGGNLASTWPQHVLERRTLGGIARAIGRPLVISGQTLGPHLTDRDRQLVGELLRAAGAVGLRESASYELARELAGPGASLTATVDDASFLSERDTEPGGCLLVSLSTHLGNRERSSSAVALARLLDRAATSTGLDVQFLAHFASLRPGEVRGDALLHEEVRAAMTMPSTVIATTDSVAAADAARGAGLVVTSRYHPAVFAAPAGVPTLGISVDDYTAVKLTGALRNFGQESVVSLDDVLAGSADSVLSASWSDRQAIRDTAMGLAQTHRRKWDAWWDLLAARLG
jgi:polysaccharide pyruvyl transferase WcaK-like protein